MLWRHGSPCPKWGSLKNNLLEQITFLTWRRGGCRMYALVQLIFAPVQWERHCVSTMDALQNLVEFYHNNCLGMLKLGCTLPNPAKICLHSSTSANFYPFRENEKNLPLKVRERVFARPSIVFTRKIVDDGNHIRNSTNVCQSIYGVDSSQLNLNSVSQPLPRGFYRRYEVV